MKQDDIKNILEQYTKKTGAEERFSSFDYCYNYFKNTDDYLADIEKSCLALGFYLASWGMYRGSSFLLNKSAKYFEPTIEYLATLDRSYWDIDVDNYSDENMDKIIDIYKNLKGRIIKQKNVHVTLITKIMLGVFGFIPAYDSFFCQTFRNIAKPKCGFRTVNKKSLSVIHDFYLQNKEDIDEFSDSTFTKDFLTSKPTGIHYSKAKIIDMYGFVKGKIGF